MMFRSSSGCVSLRSHAERLSQHLMRLDRTLLDRQDVKTLHRSGHAAILQQGKASITASSIAKLELIKRTVVQRPPPTFIFVHQPRPVFPAFKRSRVIRRE